MKNLFFLVLTLFITNGCLNQPNNNVVEQNTVSETAAVSLKDTPSPKESGFPSSTVSADQKRIFEPPKQLTLKKTSVQTRCFLPSIITIDTNPPQQSFGIVKVVPSAPCNTVSTLVLQVKN